jgi:hypothetical protein
MQFFCFNLMPRGYLRQHAIAQYYGGLPGAPYEPGEIAPMRTCWPLRYGVRLSVEENAACRRYSLSISAQ